MYYKKPTYPEFVYLILKNTNSPLTDLKHILFDKKIVSCNNELRFYAPYNVLSKVYYHKFNGQNMWGVGFRTKAIIDKAYFYINDSPSTECQKDFENDLQSFVVKADTFNFTNLCASNNDVFLIVPNKKTLDEICFHGLKAGTNYKNWWIKGLRNDCCGNKTEKEIYNYLNCYRFYPKNEIDLDFKDLFPSIDILGDDNIGVRTYSLLNESPKELCDFGQAFDRSFELSLF